MFIKSKFFEAVFWKFNKLEGIKKSQTTGFNADWREENEKIAKGNARISEILPAYDKYIATFKQNMKNKVMVELYTLMLMSMNKVDELKAAYEHIKEFGAALALTYDIKHFGNFSEMFESTLKSKIAG